MTVKLFFCFVQVAFIFIQSKIRKVVRSTKMATQSSSRLNKPAVRVFIEMLAEEDVLATLDPNGQ